MPMLSPDLPAYERIKLALLEEIRRGEYPLDRPFVTERELCERFEVSRSTAIRALNDLMRDGILSRQRGRGTYVAAPAQAAVGAGRPTQPGARLIGCIFSHLHGRHPMGIIRGIEHLCRAADYHLLLFDSEGSAHTESANLARALDVGVHGLIVYPVEGYANSAQFEALAHREIPFVLVDRYYPAIPANAVVADDFAVGFELTERLLRQGHRYIATIHEEVACTSVQDRMAGYRRAHDKHKVPIQPELAAVRSYVAISEEQRRDLLSGWLDVPYKPTAYLTSNSEGLETVLRDLTALGVRVLEEVTMASMDNANFDAVNASAADSLALPSYEVGATAMRVLLDHLGAPGKSVLRHVVVPVTAPARVREPSRRPIRSG